MNNNLEKLNEYLHSSSVFILSYRFITFVELFVSCKSSYISGNAESNVNVMENCVLMMYDYILFCLATTKSYLSSISVVNILFFSTIFNYFIFNRSVVFSVLFCHSAGKNKR